MQEILGQRKKLCFRLHKIFKIKIVACDLENISVSSTLYRHYLSSSNSGTDQTAIHLYMSRDVISNNVAF